MQKSVVRLNNYSETENDQLRRHLDTQETITRFKELSIENYSTF